MNAELRRNLWLELTLHRLLALPVGLLLIFMLVHVISEEGWRGSLAVTAATLFAAFALWGGVHAGDSVMGEVRGRTWDGQRMSAIEPWTMTWGKLAGSPAFAWYGGAICLVVYLLFSPAPDSLRTAIFLLAGALLLDAIAMIGSITASRKAVVRSSSTGWVLGIALLVVGPWMSVLGSGDADVAWWGREWRRIDFLLASTVLFAAWAVFGAYRLMCQELRVRTVPWAWPAFLVFTAAFIAGFGIRRSDTPGQQLTVLLIAGLIVSLVALYPMLLTETGGAMALRRILMRGKAREWRRLLQETPLWMVTLALALVFCALTVPLAGGGRSASNDLLQTAVLAPVPLFLLAARDAALCMFFASARQPRRAEAATLFYLLLLYWLVPMLLRTAGMQGLADLVLPPFWERPGYAAGVAAVQASLMIAAATWRWRSNYGS